MESAAALVGPVCKRPEANRPVANRPHAAAVLVGQVCKRPEANGPVANRPHEGRLRAVFLNYLLDCLPAAVLHFDGDAVRQLCVRTCVARKVRLADYTDLTADQLRQRAQSSDPRARDELLEVYGLFASEYDYQAVRDGAPLAPRADSDGTGIGQAKSARGASGAPWPAPPYFDFAVEYARGWTKRLLHSYGAIACLEKLLGMLAPGGFILVNDYGPTQTSGDDEFEHPRFSRRFFSYVS